MLVVPESEAIGFAWQVVVHGRPRTLIKVAELADAARAALARHLGEPVRSRSVWLDDARMWHTARAHPEILDQVEMARRICAHPTIHANRRPDLVRCYRDVRDLRPALAPHLSPTIHYGLLVVGLHVASAGHPYTFVKSQHLVQRYKPPRIQLWP